MPKRVRMAVASGEGHIRHGRRRLGEQRLPRRDPSCGWAEIAGPSLWRQRCGRGVSRIPLLLCATGPVSHGEQPAGMTRPMFLDHRRRGLRLKRDARQWRLPYMDRCPAILSSPLLVARESLPHPVRRSPAHTWCRLRRGEEAKASPRRRGHRLSSAAARAPDVGPSRQKTFVIGDNGFNGGLLQARSRTARLYRGPHRRAHAPRQIDGARDHVPSRAKLATGGRPGWAATVECFSAINPATSPPFGQDSRNRVLQIARQWF